MKGCLTIVVALGAMGIFLAIFSPHDAPVVSQPAQVHTPKNIASSKGAATPVATPVATPAAFPNEAYWPEKVHLTKVSQLSSSVGGGSVSITKPVGTEVWAFLSEDHKTVTVQLKNPDLKGSIPIEDTDFLEVARNTETVKKEAARREQERCVEEQKAQAAQAAAEEAARGTPPLFDVSFGGKLVVPTAVERTIKQSMKDPDSFQPRKVISAQKDQDSTGRKCWKVVFIFAGKNSFGGYTLNTCTVWMRGSSLLEYKISE